MDVQSICRDVIDTLDGSLGCVLADTETGLPLAAEYRDGADMNETMITLVSHVGFDLFHGKLVRNFERTLSRNRGAPDGFVREVQLTTRTTYQFMSAVPGWDQVIFILVTNKKVSLGMGLLAVHDAVRQLVEASARTTAPAVDPTFRPREDVPDSSPTPVRDSRRLEPTRDSRFDPRQRDVAHDGTPAMPGRQEFGVEPEPQQQERSAAPRARVPVAPQANVPAGPVPEAPPRAPAAPPAEPPQSPIGETPELAAQAAGDAHPEADRYYRGVRLEDAKTTAANTDESTRNPVPIGPRARMFFKRPKNERENGRTRRS